VLTLCYIGSSRVKSMFFHSPK